MSIIIKNGLIVDPVNNLEAERMDILITGKKISRVSKNIKTAADIIIDAGDKIIMPGLVDMHVHLREPGREDKETVSGGRLAALKGGVTSLLAMPNTQPAMDSCEHIKLLQKAIKNSSGANVFICGAITQERLGKLVTDVAALKKCRIVAISDDGASVDDEAVFLEALKRAKQNKLPVICHCEDRALSSRGVVNLGIISTKLGLRGISRESEYRRVERDIKLAQMAKAAIHIAHVSCRESVEIISAAKKKGVRVTAETAPHYFALSEDSVSGYNTNMKMNPPLRAKEDVEAIKQGLKRDIIDAIASDHAPHTENEKDIEFDRAEFGVVGLETELSVSITELINSGVLSWTKLAEKLSVNPAKILGLNKGSLGPGQDADMVIISPDKKWVAEKEKLVSKSKNSAFLGKELNGVVEYTICAGKISYQVP